MGRNLAHGVVPLGIRNGALDSSSWRLGHFQTA